MSAMDRIFRRGRERRARRLLRGQDQGNNAQRVPNRKFLLEPLDPRLLLSGDINPLAAGGPLEVTQFEVTPSGFTAHFDAPLDATVLNLYDAEAAGFGPADVTVTGSAAGPISGSLVVDDDTIHFISAGGLLSPDTYTVTLRSGINAFKDSAGNLLDGNRDGTAGDHYNNIFVVGAGPSPVIVSIRDVVRGPSQAVDVASGGLPVRLSDGSGVTSVTLELDYDPELLKVLQVTAGPGLPAGTQLQSDLTVQGHVTVTVNSPSAMAGGSVELLRLGIEVPNDAPLGKSAVLDLNGISINGGAIPAVGDDGVQVVAYFGEATGNGIYTALDAARILRVTVGLDSGFALYPAIHPFVIADITGNNILSAQDGTRVLQEVVGIDRPEISSIVPVVLPALTQDTGASANDRLTSNPGVSGTVRDDGTIATFMVGIDDALPEDFTDVTADLQVGAFTFTRTRLEEIHGGALTDGPHTLHLQATDSSGNTPSPVHLSFTLDTVAPVINSFLLSTGSDTGAVGDNITAASLVALAGTAEAGASLTLGSTQVLVAGSGLFQIPDIALNQGANPFTLSSIDLAGNSAQALLTITREGIVTADVVLTWNQQALEAIRLTVTDPPPATRVLAMVGLAQYDTLAAIEGTPPYLIQYPAAGPISLEAALAKAAHTVLYALFPSLRANFDATLNTLLASLPNGIAKDNALALGQAVGAGVLAIRASDGSAMFVDYSGSTSPGIWRPTAPMFDVADQPQWADMTPFALTSPDQFRPSAPPALDSAAYAQAVEEIRNIGSATSAARTADQSQTAQFWADGKGSYTPPGHWNEIAQQVALAQGNSLAANVRLFAKLNVALADAAIAAWDAKYTYGLWRPIDAIHDAEMDNNPGTTEDDTWTPLLITPPHPEYISGHSSFSSAAAAILASVFGDAFAFSTTSYTLPGVTRNFSSFTQAAQEAGRSRVFGGIHYEFTNQAGKVVGQQVANQVLSRFELSQDVQPPVIFAATTPAVSNTNLTLEGQIFDNLSGVAAAQYRVDNGVLQTLALDSQGRFTIATGFALDGSQDGVHTVSILARDAANNAAQVFTRTFVLDSTAPGLTLTSIADGATIDPGSRLIGTASATGSALTLLNYKFDNGSVRSIIFDASGNFDVPLFIGSLGEGAHVLALTAKDAAGNETTLIRNVTLTQAIPFQVSTVSPLPGSIEVGVTFKPQIIFSRSVDPATLTNNSLFATGPDGQKIAASIVPSADGTFAWLFFNAPLAGGSAITIRVDGELIRSAGDQIRLDGDGNGSPGGVFTSTFTTVSTTSVPGTRVVGKVVDPGPDLEPMTFDDVRRGPDGIIHTPDDVFLNPIAHVKVFILGQESNFVFTDAAGNFELNSAPVGNVKIALDGRTATNPPEGIFFPEMVMDVSLQPGITQTLMGSMGTLQERQANADRLEVYLPRVATSVLQVVSDTQSTTITVDEMAAPNLTDSQRNALTLTIDPGSAVGENGQVLSNVQIGISTVPPELVRDMLPPGVLQHTFDITIQAPGVATFSEPLRITFPNVFNAAPGTKLNILSFDHTTGRLVINGTATVSADGLTVVADPGSGIEAPGWHGVTPPGDCNGSGGPPPVPPPPVDDETVTEHDPVALHFATGDTDFLGFTTRTWTAPGQPPDVPPPPPPPPGGWTPPPRNPDGTQAPFITVIIEIDGPLNAFAQKTATSLPLVSQAFTLQAGSGETKVLDFFRKSYEEMFGAGGFQNLNKDQLYGAKIKITEIRGHADGSRERDIYTYYSYRWVDVVDANAAKAKQGATAAFFKTLADGAGAFERNKFIDAHLPSSVTTNYTSEAPFEVNDPGTGEFLVLWKFDPDTHGDFSKPVKIVVNDPDLPNGGEVGALSAIGKGNRPTKLSVNLDDPATGYQAELERVLMGLRFAWTGGADLEAGVAGVDDDGIGGVDNLTEYGYPGSDDAREVVYDHTGTSFSTSFIVGPDGKAGAAGVDDDGANGVDDIGELGFAGSDDRFVHVINPLLGGGFKNVGTAASPDYRANFRIASSRFRGWFTGFMPNERADAGADGILLTADDLFTAAQLTAMATRISTEADALLAAVQIDFSAIADALILQRVNAGADVVMTWQELGTGLFGGTSKYDSDLAKMRELVGTQGRTDPITGNTYNLEISEAAQQWALAQYINPDPADTGQFAVGINVNFSNLTTTFAQYVANTVSHELGHTFGLNEGYFSEGDVFDGTGVRPGGGTAQVNGSNNAFPYDIMSNGQPGDPNLKFEAPTAGLLKAATGLLENTSLPLTEALKLWRNTFNLVNGRYADGGHDQNGIRDVSDNPSTEGEIRLAEGEDLFFGFSGQSAEIGEAGADGVAGLYVERTFDVFNYGGGALTLSSVFLELSTAGFAIAGPSLAGTTLQPGESAALTIRFDPAGVGPLQDTLTIVSDAGFSPVFVLDLAGTGISFAPVAEFSVLAFNNLGGVPVASGSILRQELFEIANRGTQPLLISGVDIADGGASFSLSGVPGDLATTPISLDFGESYVFGVAFDPDREGLLRGLINVSTNDPIRPALQLGVTGTGLPDVVYPEWGDDFIVIQMSEVPGSIPLRAKSDKVGSFSFFLPAEEAYHLIIFDPVTGLVSHSYGSTRPSGSTVDLTRNIVFLASAEEDTDFDGLPDDIEFVIGSGVTDADTDNDGLSDFTEIRQGLDPLGGFGIPTGIVAAVAVAGSAQGVVVESAIGNPDDLTAYVATGTHGLVLVDATQIANPVVLGGIDLPGNNVDVAVDSKLAIAAVAGSAGGLHLVDVANPALPVLLRTVVLAEGARRVAATDGIAYVASGTGILSVDLLTGDIRQTLSLGSAEITDLAIDASVIYTMDAANTLRAVTVSQLNMTARDAVTLPDGGGRLFVGNGVAYVAGEGAFLGGFATADVADPDNLSLLSGVDDGSLAGHAIAANGSGLAVVVGQPGGAGGARAIDLVSVADPANTGVLITRFTAAVTPVDVAIASGVAFVADGTGGLLVVNYRSFDTQGQPPAVTVVSQATDVDPGTPGIQVLEGRTFRVVPTITDDIQVRNVELLVNNQVVINDVSFPFDLLATAPAIALGGTTLTIRVRATDTGGNVTLSTPLLFDVVPDTFAPAVVVTRPLEGARSFFIPSLDVRFDEGIDEALLSISGAHLTHLGADQQFGTPDDEEVALESMTLRDFRTFLSILPDPILTAGDYRLVIDPEIVADIAGNPLDEPFTLNFTIRPASEVQASSGSPAIAQAPSANPGQEIGIEVPWGPVAARMAFVVVDSAGTSSTRTVEPSRVDSISKMAFFIVPDDALTGDVTVSAAGVINFTGLPDWNVVNGSVDLLGNGFDDLLPGNGLYLDLDGSTNNGGRIESKVIFDLMPGQYELRFDLAGSQRFGFNDIVTVSLGGSFNEQFTREIFDPFATIVRLIDVTEAEAASLVFDHAGSDNAGLLLDNVRLTRVDTSAVLLDDSFELPFTDGTFLLQIVPVITGLDLFSVLSDGSSGGVMLTGKGFVEGRDTEYRFGTEVLADVNVFSGPDVFGANTFVNLTLPLAPGAFGAVVVETEGGTSAPFVVGFTDLTSTAMSGMPADANLDSANPGQAVTVSGSGLTTASDFILRWVDSSGSPRATLLNPTVAAIDGTVATLLAPGYANGAFPLQAPGSAFAPQLQIVPVVTALDVTGTNAIRVTGRGFVEGDTSYQFDGVTVVDTVISTGPNVVGLSVDNDGADIATPVHGYGTWQVTTDGGTSAPLSLNVLTPGAGSTLLGLLRDVAYDAVNDRLYIITNQNPAQVHQIDPASGQSLSTFSLTAPVFGSTAFSGGLQILTDAVAQLGTAVDVAAGSLLVVNGAPNPDRIVAVNAITGAVIPGATVPLAAPNTNLDVVAGVYHAGTQKLYLVDASPDQVVVVNPVTGVVESSFSVPLNLGNAGIAVHPVTGNLWIGGSGNDIVEMTPAGALVSQMSLAMQGINSSDISGLAFRNASELYVASSLGVVYRVSLASATPGAPALTAINGVALGGTPANAGQASANVGQVVELVGTNFRMSDLQVQFAVRDAEGMESIEAVTPLVVNADGTRAQVVVPDLAQTGPVEVVAIGSQNQGFVSYNDAIYRNVTVEFTPDGTTAEIQFQDTGLQGINDESWGLDNVRVGLAATPGTYVFEDSFQGGASGNWSSGVTDNSLPGVFGQFSGRFSNQSQTLTLNGLTAGETFRLTFDLYVLDSWDGAHPNSGPDYFDVFVDSVRQFHESFTNFADPRSVQTYGATGNVLLQVVPVIESVLNGRPGEDDSFDLSGSGFMEGGTTLNVGGISFPDLYRNLFEFDVFGARNDTFRIVTPLTVEGPIRVTTTGGFHEVAGPPVSSPGSVVFTGIQPVVAFAGTAFDPQLPSANTGQRITLNGAGFAFNTLVQFAASDDTGTLGTITRTGSSTDGSTLTVEVPALARTGMVRVVGNDAAFPLQVVPTVRSFGGTVAAGNTVILDGTGLVRGQLSVRIDGIVANVQNVRTLLDGSDPFFGPGDVESDQQLVTLTVPNGVGAGVITVTTDGGTAVLRRVTAPVTQTPSTPVIDVGDSLTDALALTLPANSQLTVSQHIGDGLFGDLDVDLYRFFGVAGDRVTLAMNRLQPSTAYSWLRLFGSTGTELTTDGFSGPDDTPRIETYVLPGTGTYYVGVSAYPNLGYDPQAGGSGQAGGTGSYDLSISRLQGTSLTGIASTAASGTPAQASVASANFGQTLTISGTGLLDSDQVVFAALSDSGNRFDETVTPLTVAADGTSLTVVVPDTASSGTVRLARESTGIFLQVVPVLSDVDLGLNQSFNSGALQLFGSGFAESLTTVDLGGSLLSDVARFAGVDVFGAFVDGAFRNNAAVYFTVPAGVPVGPIRVTTPGGTSAPFALTFSGIVAAAESGVPAVAGPSANPGQVIILQGTGLDLTTDVVFQAQSFGSRYERTARPASVNTAGTALSVVVPNDAATGVVRLVGDQLNSNLLLQIVPVVSGLNVNSVSTNGATATVTLSGKGFVEGSNSVYRLGNVSVIDPSENTGPSATGSSVLLSNLPLTAGVFGAIVVETEGGTSAPFLVGFTDLTASVMSGTAANIALDAANPGQSITVSGNGLTTATDFILRWIDSAGNPRATLLNPTIAAIDGASATLLIPGSANGAFPLQALGSGFSPLLQIVPVVTALDLNGVNAARLTGRGFVEGGSTYDFAGVAVVDAVINAGANVLGSAVDNDTADLTLPVHGYGAWQVTTAGGTSAPVNLNMLTVGNGSALLGQLRDMAYDAVNDRLYVITNQNPAQVHQIDPATGQSVSTFNLSSGVFGSTAFFGGLQILPEAAAQLGTAVNVPAGSLLVVNGSPSPDRIVAVNAVTGAAIAGATVSPAAPNGNLDVVAGAYHAGTQKLYLVDNLPDQVVVVDPVTGVVESSFAVPMDLNNAGVAIHPVTGNLWIGGSGNDIVEMTTAGTTLRQMSLVGQGANNFNITGLAFRNGAELYVASSLGSLYLVNLTPAAQGAPTLTSINAAALGGTPANAGQASANAGQVVELVGTNFRMSDLQVQIAVRDGAGVESIVAVSPLVVSGDGTRAQVVVPDLAQTGVVNVVAIGSQNRGFVSHDDAIYRNIAVEFTPGGTTAEIQFQDSGLQGIADESWGLDNVRVALAATPGSYVFEDGFQGGANAAWSSSLTDNTLPGMFGQFSGRFSNEIQTLALSGLAPGEPYQLTFDLYVLDSWDGTNPTNGPDYFDVFVDGERRFHESFTNVADPRSVQTFGAVGNLPLQIVPLITGLESGGRPGQDSSFDLRGSGFMEGASTIQIGGVSFPDLYTNLFEFDVFGARNDTFRLVTPLTLEGPIRVTTAGGFHEIPGPVFTPPVFVNFTGIQPVTAMSGNADDPLAPSANTGQRITLIGEGFLSGTEVQFSSGDDTGALGTISRTGSVDNNGTTLSVEVPALARTGMVRVAGDDATFMLQIVPTLRSAGGTFAPGNTLILEGSGFAIGQLTVLIDGVPAAIQTIQTIIDGIETFFGDPTQDQQLVTVTVPAGVTGGVIAVVTDGGTSTLQQVGALTVQPNVTPPGDVGDSIASALLLPLPVNSRATVSQSIGDGAFGDLDVDLFRFSAVGGDTVSVTMTRLQPFDSYAYLRFFDAAGNLLTEDGFSGDNDTPLIGSFVLPGTGDYFVGVSGWPNYLYDPSIPGSGDPAGVGAYDLSITRLQGSSLSGITASASSGTPTHSGVASANAGQTITISGAGLLSDDQVVFTGLSGSADLYDIPVTPDSVAPDGTSLDVVVPHGTISGMVRLQREGAGVFLQIVPTISDVDLGANESFPAGNLLIRGSGFAESATAILFGAQGLPDPGRYYGIDVSYDFVSTLVENAIAVLTVPSGVPTGPITVRTAGGVSEAFNLSFIGVTATALSGTPALSTEASANPGQTITLQGSGLDLTTDVVFEIAEADGSRSRRVARPAAVDAGGTEISVVVPEDAATGMVAIVGDMLSSEILLQIIPVVTNIDLTFINANQANFTLTGHGFIEGNGTLYQIGAVEIADFSSNAGPNTSSLNTRSDIVTAFSNDIFGPVVVVTDGGTSGPFSIGYSELNGTATFGTPANAGLASANPGQLVTLNGTGFTATTDIVARYVDSGGTLIVQMFNPTSVAGGIQATWTVPAQYNGAFTLNVFGAAFAPVLQIVPLLDSFDVLSTNQVRILGKGFVEGDTTFTLGGVAMVDASTSGSPINVFSSGVDNAAADLAPAAPHPAGILQITTDGGTSAPITLNLLSPGSASTPFGFLQDVAYDAANDLLWIVTNQSPAQVHQVDPATGQSVSNFTMTALVFGSTTLSNGGIQVLAEAIPSLGGTLVPAGSLLFFNGSSANDRIVAVDTAGNLIASITLGTNYDMVGGAYDAAADRLYILDGNPDQVVVLVPATGAQETTFASSIDVNNGDLDIHPTTGNLWIGSSNSSNLVEITTAGVVVRQVALGPLGIGNEVTGVAFRTADEIYLSSTLGVIYIAPDPLVELADAEGAPGSTATVAVNIDNANYLQSVELEIHYDTSLLDVDESGIRLGSLTGEGSLSADVDDPGGMIFVSILLPAPLGPGGGSLLEIDFLIASHAPTGRTVLDLQRVSLNEDALILTKVPAIGEDPTDGAIRIVRSAPERKDLRELDMDRLIAWFDLPGSRLHAALDRDAWSDRSGDFRKALGKRLRGPKIRWD